MASPIRIPPPPSSLDQHDSEHHSCPPPPKKWIPDRREIAGITIGSTLFTALLILIIVRYIRKRNFDNNASTTRNLNDNPTILFNTQEDFLDEEQGPQLDHPIWYIRTVGLDRSVIESIAVFNYKAGDGLIEGTECSVCLGEFRDDESLRLLPKCSHAFHVQCIDTWLQSHTNCPLCRAPIVRARGAEQASLEVPTTVGSSSSGPTVQGNLGMSATSSDLRVSRVGDVVAGENGIEDGNFDSSRIEDAGKIRALLNPVKSQLRVVSDLGDRGRVVGEDIQRGRRSCSMDSPSAAEIYHAVVIATCDRVRGSSKRQALEMKKLGLSTNKPRLGGSGSSSLYRLVKSCSFRASLPVKPVSMKRTLSSNGNFRSLGQ